MVGSLMYFLDTTPDLTYEVWLVARYLEIPIEIHLAATKRILRHLKGTVNLGVLYKMNDELVLQGWSDSDYVFKLGKEAAHCDSFKHWS